MSGSEDRNEHLDKSSPAFEYVAGTLPPAERRAFEESLSNDPQLQRDIRFWEEHFMGLQNRRRQLPPKPGAWEAIATRIGVMNVDENLSGQGPSRWRWWIAGAAMAMLATVAVMLPQFHTTRPNTDYVAVLTDSTGAARLTALTTGDNQTMWLQWNQVTLEEDSSLQLWAQSRRDGQTRPIAVFDRTDVAQLSLSQAEWRLVKDAEKLVLTQEEIGGSPLNMPSDIIVATGVCVRFEATKESAI